MRPRHLPARSAIAATMCFAAIALASVLGGNPPVAHATPEGCTNIWWWQTQNNATIKGDNCFQWIPQTANWSVWSDTNTTDTSYEIYTYVVGESECQANQWVAEEAYLDIRYNTTAGSAGTSGSTGGCSSGQTHKNQIESVNQRKKYSNSALEGWAACYNPTDYGVSLYCTYP